MRDMQAEIATSLEKNGQSLKHLKELVESKSELIQQMVADFSERLEKLKK